MAPRLKVFTWSDGFHAYTVAASSRPKALKAWGVSQDLFATGLAKEIYDGPDHDAALAEPGEVIQRGEAIDKGLLKRPAKRPKPDRADAARAAVQKLESELAGLDEAQELAEEAFDARRRELEAEAEASARAHEQARRELKTRLSAARKAV